MGTSRMDSCTDTCARAHYPFEEGHQLHHYITSRDAEETSHQLLRTNMKLLHEVIALNGYAYEVPFLGLPIWH